MRILMVGLSHRTAQLALRERTAVGGDALPGMLDQLRSAGEQVEAVILSTCNRTELYVARPPHGQPDGDALRSLLSGHCGLPLEQLSAVTIERQQEQAALHLFRVCGGLDSMVLGETQILGQVKRAYEAAANHGSVGPVLHRLFQDAIKAGKRLRHQTGIGEGRLSIGSVALDLARQVFDRFDDKTLLALGAGEMMKVALTHFRRENPQRVCIVNRTADRALELVERLHLGEARAMADLDGLLVEADVLLTCTGSTEPVLTAERMKQAVKRRRRRPLLVLDLGVPRDVEQTSASLANVYLYNLDDLQSVVAASMQSRRGELEACEHHLAQAVALSMTAIQQRDVGRLVKQLRGRFHEMGNAELQRTLRLIAAEMGSSDADAINRVIEQHTTRLINKILHLPLSRMRQPESDAPLAFYAAALRRLFDLDESEDDASPEDQA
ncbi:MAG: glutamyl-tRNA reductase [Phycisphaeraceae bacterium]|nr:glutamyl-tRNA reductase [Phycisphaeraceae bacterium]